jgi:GGDEF domain-containing protein
LLEKFSDLLKNHFQHYHIYRIFGDTFIILSADYLDMSTTIPIATKFLEEKKIILTLAIIHLIEERIDSISKLEEVIKTQQSLKI